MMTKEKNETNSKQRVQFDFTPDALKRLEDLKDEVDATTKAEVVRRALKLYEWLVNVSKFDQNSVIAIQDKDGKAVYRIDAKTLL